MKALRARTPDERRKADKPYAFYPSMAVLVCARGDGAPRPARMWRRARFFCSRSRCRNVDALYGLPLVATTAAPTYSYRAARQSDGVRDLVRIPQRKWIRGDGIRAAIDAPDAQKKLLVKVVEAVAGAHAGDHFGGLVIAGEHVHPVAALGKDLAGAIESFIAQVTWSPAAM